MVFSVYIRSFYVEAMTEEDQDVSCRGCHKEGARPLANYSEDHDCQECHTADYFTSKVADKGILLAEKGKAHTPADKKFEGMIYIPSGEFVMGSNKRHPDEGPPHKVYVEAYYIDRYEVINARYKEFVDVTGHEPPSNWKNGTYTGGKEKHPVTFVNWFDATAYCQWAGKRLPTEAEWEKAARGTDERTFPWGNIFDPKKCNCPQTEIGDTMPVGSFEDGKSPYGLYDVSGNVWEWTVNWYQPYPGNDTPSDFYGEKNKVLRGGSWYDCLSYNCGVSAPTFNRSHFNPKVKNKSFGFRCAKSP